MKIGYFQDADTLDIEFEPLDVVEKQTWTKTLLALDGADNIAGILNTPACEPTFSIFLDAAAFLGGSRVELLICGDFFYERVATFVEPGAPAKRLISATLPCANGGMIP